MNIDTEYYNTITNNTNTYISINYTSMIYLHNKLLYQHIKYKEGKKVTNIYKKTKI